MAGTSTPRVGFLRSSPFSSISHVANPEIADFARRRWPVPCPLASSSERKPFHRRPRQELRPEPARAAGPLRDPRGELPQDPAVGIHRGGRPPAERRQVIPDQIPRASLRLPDEPQVPRLALRHRASERFSLRVSGAHFARFRLLRLPFGSELAPESTFPYEFSVILLAT
jgi:hypothetical protein